jgi:hypothetical protein
VRQLALRAALVARGTLVASGSEMSEPAGQLPILALGRGRGPQEGAVRVEVVAAPQERLTDEERSLDRIG